MKKRFLCLALVFVMVFSMITNAMAANVGPFVDVPQNSWFADYVSYVYNNGLMDGVGNNRFDPNGTMTRGMVATILYRAAGSKDVEYRQEFTDVTEGLWYSNAVIWAADMGIVNGMGDGTFRPNQSITRQELTTMLYRYAGSPVSSGSYSSFKDQTDVAAFAAEATQWAVENGILGGYADGTLRPAANVSRAEAAKMLTIFLNPDLEEKEEEEQQPPYTPSGPNGRVLSVAQDGTAAYDTIQEAVNAAMPGDTVVVHEGTYREEVVLPRGGSSENKRITLSAAYGEEVIVTGAEIVTGWEPTDVDGVYTLKLAKDFFSENAEGVYFNPFNVWWMAKGGATSGSMGNYYSCGCVYLNGTELLQRWAIGDVHTTANTWFATVDEQTGETTLTVNFGAGDPNAENAITEVNNRMQCITAKWNQGYITIDGITVMHGCGPKTIDFWMTTAEAMYGAIATNGGHHWIIENCTATGNRGVAIDFGNGSGKQELKYGGEPELYGYHIIRDCNVSYNGTNGMMAYRGAYTEIYGCTLANNNTLNTGLLSEAYIKDVSGGWGIKIHDNYFFTDQDAAARPIWLDCECDGSEITNNIICDAKNGFTYVDLECNAGWILVANNILVSTGWGQVLQSHSYLVNNLFLMNGQTSNTTWNSNSSTAMPGAEGYDGYSRAMRITEPGTLNFIGQEETSRFETYNRFNKLMNNIFFDQGVKAATSRGGGEVMAPNEADFNGVYTEVYLNPDPAANKDYSGGCWKDPAMNDKYKGILAWIPVEGDDSLKTATMLYGNECDYNVYYGGAQSINKQYSNEYVADEHSIVVDGGDYTFIASPERFELILTVDDSVSSINAPAMTGKLLGAATLFEQEGYEFYAPDVDTDFFGNDRDEIDTVVGPFADLEAGTNTYVCWPQNEAGKTGYEPPVEEEDSIEGFVAREFEASNGVSILYRIREGSADNQPLVIWQHGSGAVGTDNEKQLNANDRASFIFAEYSDDCSVLAAQYPYKFSTPYLEGEEEDMDAWLEAYAELIQSLIDAGKVDVDRVYVAGGSMGGGVVMEFITQYPDLFAAAVAMCPRGTINGDLTCLDAVVDLPLWLFHTEGDKTNATSISDEISQYLTEAGSEVMKYTRYTAEDMTAGGLTPGLEHNASWRLGLADEELFTWLFAQSK